MRILCDTCSVLMVIRVAPDMFVNQRFGCATIPKVYDEIFKKQKFKTKYPWRDQFKNKIVALGTSELTDSLVDTHLSTIEFLVQAGVLNSNTGRLVDLSPTDKLSPPNKN